MNFTNRLTQLENTIAANEKELHELQSDLITRRATIYDEIKEVAIRADLFKAKRELEKCRQ